MIKAKILVVISIIVSTVGLPFLGAIPAGAAVYGEPNMFPHKQNVGGRVNLLPTGGGSLAFSESSSVHVYVGGVEADVIEFDASGGSIYFLVPEISGGAVYAVVNGKEYYFGGLETEFNQSLRYITAISPNVVRPGETVVTIKGSGFGNKFFPGALSMGGVAVTSATWSNSEIKFVAPPSIPATGNVRLRKLFLEESSGAIVNGYDYVIRPGISDFYPVSGGSSIFGDDQVAVDGGGFDFLSGKQKVFWGPYRMRACSKKDPSPIIR